MDIAQFKSYKKSRRSFWIRYCSILFLISGILIGPVSAAGERPRFMFQKTIAQGNAVVALGPLRDTVEQACQDYVDWLNRDGPDPAWGLHYVVSTEIYREAHFSESGKLLSGPGARCGIMPTQLPPKIEEVGVNQAVLNYSAICDGVRLSNGLCACASGTLDANGACEHRNAGGCQVDSGTTMVGNPVTLAYGNKFQREVDVPFLPSGLGWARDYNSLWMGSEKRALGKNWRHFYDKRLVIETSSRIKAYREDGKVLVLILNSDGTYRSVSGTEILRFSSPNYTLTLPDDSAESYNTAGQLTAITQRSGEALRFQYSDWTTAKTIAPYAGLLIIVQDFLGRSINLGYDSNGRISTLTDPAGGLTRYAYDASDHLTSVTYPDNTSKTYHYENYTFPNALTGITDERGVRYATYTYDTTGRAIATEHANGIDRHQLSYGATNTVVTDPLGSQRTYTFQTILGIAKNTSVSQPGGSGCGPASQTQTYDAQGNLASSTDFNGIKTTYSYDLTRHLETSRTEGLSSSGSTLAQTRIVTTSWHPSWRLPQHITVTAAGAATPMMTKTFDVDTRGRLVKHTWTQGTTTQTSTATYTDSATIAGLTVRTVLRGPRSQDIVTIDFFDETSSCVGCRGQIKQITDALGQAISFTAYTAFGQAQAISDSDGNTLTVAYDRRQRPTAITMNGETVNLNTTATGQISQLTLPDASTITSSYDNAQRLVSLRDTLGHALSLTLDAAGHPLQENRLDEANTLQKNLTYVIDALGRVQTQIGVATRADE